MIVTDCEEVIWAGAVYKPLLMLPIAGFKVHVTVVLVVPERDAENCCVWDAVRVAVAGATDTVTGTRLTVAEADWVGSATLVTVIVMA